jgi:diadenosine tetraphosphate (Ap4A) HIT family hydrolase
MPKEHYAIMPQIPEKEMGHLFLVAKYLSQALLKVLKVSGTNIFVANGPAAGQRAQHFMLHLIPRKDGDKLLEAEDKLVDHNLRGKVKELIAPKLNALLGVKKETQKTLEEEKNLVEIGSHPQKDIFEEEEEKTEQEGKEEEIKEEAPKEAESEGPEEKPKENQKKDAKSKPKKEKKSLAKEKPAKKSRPEKAPSLDDIANLFK